jgi:hypothetical protein
MKQINNDFQKALMRAELTDKVKHDSGRENIWRNLKRLNNSQWLDDWDWNKAFNKP